MNLPEYAEQVLATLDEPAAWELRDSNDKPVIRREASRRRPIMQKLRPVKVPTGGGKYPDSFYTDVRDAVPSRSSRRAAHPPTRSRR